MALTLKCLVCRDDLTALGPLITTLSTAITGGAGRPALLGIIGTAGGTGTLGYATKAYNDFGNLKTRLATTDGGDLQTKAALVYTDANAFGTSVTDAKTALNSNVITKITTCVGAAGSTPYYNWMNTAKTNYAAMPAVKSLVRNAVTLGRWGNSTPVWPTCSSSVSKAGPDVTRPQALITR